MEALATRIKATKVCAQPIEFGHYGRF